MNVYIVTESSCAMVGIESVRLVQVSPVQEVAFQKEYAGRILAAGSSIKEAVIKFGLLVGG